MIAYKQLTEAKLHPHSTRNTIDNTIQNRIVMLIK